MWQLDHFSITWWQLDGHFWNKYRTTEPPWVADKTQTLKFWERYAFGNIFLLNKCQPPLPLRSFSLYCLSIISSVYLTCAFSIATSTEDPLSEAKPIRLHIPLALSLWSDLDLRKIYLDWVLGKKLQPWLLGEHQSNSLLPSPQVPILYKKLQYTSHTASHLIKHVICVGS